MANSVLLNLDNQKKSRMDDQGAEDSQPQQMSWSLTPFLDLSHWLKDLWHHGKFFSVVLPPVLFKKNPWPFSCITNEREKGGIARALKNCWPPGLNWHWMREYESQVMVAPCPCMGSQYGHWIRGSTVAMSLSLSLYFERTYLAIGGTPTLVS